MPLQTIYDSNDNELEVEYELRNFERGYYQFPENIASYIEPTAEIFLVSVFKEGKDIVKELSNQEEKYIIDRINF